MNAETIIQEVELIAWSMAEAEALERRTHKIRMDAARMLARIKTDMGDALAEAVKKKAKETPQET